MTIELMAAKAQDLEQLNQIYLQLNESGSDPARMKSAFDSIRQNPDYYLLVAKREDQIVGTLMGIVCHVLADNCKPFLVVENVVVREDYRRQGIAQKMFQRIEEWAKEKGCGYSLLVSGGARTWAHQFYEKVGYNDFVRGFRKIY